jgi:hypothetical protein
MLLLSVQLPLWALLIALLNTPLVLAAAAAAQNTSYQARRQQGGARLGRVFVLLAGGVTAQG